MLFDVIVVGGGHAGIEAALAAARMGAGTLLISQRLDTIGVLSCNPAFGGPAKGGLVREVDALGGFCGFMADRAAIQCRTLGESKGPAARSTRMLVDRAVYSAGARDWLRERKNLTVLEGEASAVLTKNGRASGIELCDGRTFLSGAVVLAGGTFWRGMTWRGRESAPGGRIGEPPANLLSLSLARLGHTLGRLSTCTAPRIEANTVKIDELEEQPGDSRVRPFSVLNDSVNNTASCRLTWTNPETHRLVAASFRDSIFYDGETAAPPRYCPSIEDKVRHFPTRERHHIFLEPDGGDIIFPSGIPTGLAPAVQLAMLRTMPGLTDCELAWAGYAIEYDFSDPCELAPTLESLKIPGLFLAGQINGTSGYEEAAAQGLLAGLNATLIASGGQPVILARSEALTGVMADDLSGRGVTEPYRMFTSRAEWRLLLREDNADLRLSPLAEKLGLLDVARSQKLRQKQEDMARGQKILTETRLTPQAAKTLGLEALELKEPTSAAELLKRPAASLELLLPFAPELATLAPRALDTLEIEIKFAGYITRQQEEVARLRREEELPIPGDLDFMSLSGLTTEVKEALTRHRPISFGQASRLPGLTPAAMSVLAVYLKRLA